ncbi:MAG: hypothetical protein WAL87_09965 [Chthoniobacterales bacterium]
MTRELPQFVRDLLSAPPERGAGLNLWLFRVARCLHPYRSEPEIVALLSAATGGLTVKLGEIERAVRNSRSAAWSPDQPATMKPRAATWPTVDSARREAAASTGNLSDLWEASPVRLEDNINRAELVIDTLFEPDSLLCVGKSMSDFKTRHREELRGELSEMALIVPSPMSAVTGLTQDGRPSEHTLSNTGDRRFLVIEQDSGTLDDQAGVLLHLKRKAPMVLAVHSGSKSIHGWFYCQGRDEEFLRKFMRYAVALGADRATWTRSQFVRMPDGLRDTGARQTVFYFDPSRLTHAHNPTTDP